MLASFRSRPVPLGFEELASFRHGSRRSSRALWETKRGSVGTFILRTEVDDVRVAGGGGEHEGRLVGVVEGRVGVLVVEVVDEDAHDGQVAEGGSEVEGRVGLAGDGVVWVVDEVGVGAEDPGDERGVGGVDGSPKAEGRVDPGWT